MKKNILKALMVLSALSLATSAFAAEVIEDGTSVTIGGGTFKTSKGVKLSTTSTTAAYSAISGHTQGDKEFGTNNLDPKIYQRAKNKGTEAVDCDNVAYDFSDWTAQ